MSETSSHSVGYDETSEGDIVPPTERDDDLYDDDGYYDDLIGQQEAHDQAMRELEELRQEAGPAVKLGRRAVGLLAAFDEYAKANSLDGFMRSGEPMVSKESVDQARKRHAALGDRALKNAFGWQEMIASGMDPQDVQELFVITRFGFRQKYLDPKDKQAGKRRDIYRKQLSQQIKK